MERRCLFLKEHIQITVMLTFDFDAETLWLSRDPENTKRPGTLSQGVFGAKIGVENILELLKKEELLATFFIPGAVVEKHKNVVLKIKDYGHEIGHHSYSHNWISPDYPEEERKDFEKAMSIYKEELNIKPLGYRSPAWETSEQTFELLKEFGFLYSSNMMDDISPYKLNLGGVDNQLVELPVSWLLDDAPFFMFSPKPPSRPIHSAQSVLELWKEEFHGLYKAGGLFNLTLHPQFIGRPSRILMLEELIRFIKSYPNVEFLTGYEVATRYLEKGEDNNEKSI